MAAFAQAEGLRVVPVRMVEDPRCVDCAMRAPTTTTAHTLMINATCTMAMLLFLPLRLLPTDIEQN